MSTTELLGDPVPVDIDNSLPREPVCSKPRPLPVEPTSTSSWRVMPWIAIAAALVIGAVLGVAAQITPRNAPVGPSAMAPAAPRPEIGQVAELFVAVQLTGMVAETDLALLHPETGTRAATTGYWVNRTAAVAIEPVTEESWLVTVAADMLELVDGGYEPAGIQHFQVTVATSGSRPTVVSEPARIPSPRPSVPPNVPVFAGPVSPEQTDTVEAFLRAYLTPDGEPQRYLAPTARIPMFATPAYEALASIDMASDPLGRVRALVEATSRNGSRSSLEYVLELALDSGVWTVARLTSAMDAP